MSKQTIKEIYSDDFSLHHFGEYPLANGMMHPARWQIDFRGQICFAEFGKEEFANHAMKTLTHHDDLVQKLKNCILWISQEECTGQKEINRKAFVQELSDKFAEIEGGAK